ncbi:CCC motif membrane protein [Flavobacterium sp.]|jgi:hypothetical protein|uniref:CCC motif membrane protein n=1 Tax=Flavobacterium sp. TaxID=239 RepID=UPI0037530C72
MNYNKLSADPTALILGIVSLVLMIFGCCCGFVVAIALILSIIGLVMAIKSLNEFDANPENYSIQSRKNVYAAKIICIIGTVLSSLYIVMLLVALFFYQINLSDKFKDIYNQSKEIREQSSDSVMLNGGKDEIYIENDSIYIDTNYTDSIKTEVIK